MAACVLGGDGDRERLWIGVADIFRGEPHQSSRDVERIFASLEHARQPVDRGIGIAVAHGLVQRGNQVVVLLSSLVVEKGTVLCDIGNERGIDVASCGRGCGGELEEVESDARVAIGESGHGRQGLLIHGQIERPEATSPILERSLQNGQDSVRSERLQHVDLGP
jgi:hypothetical protein